MKTLGDPVIRGNFEIILMGNNPQMRHAPQRGPRFSFVRNVKIVFRMSKLHRNLTMHGIGGSAKSIPGHVPIVWTKAPATP